MIGYIWLDILLVLIFTIILYFSGFNAINILLLVLQIAATKMQVHEKKYHKEPTTLWTIEEQKRKGEDNDITTDD